MKQHYRISISGRVQGVGFRFEARRMARVLGIKGIVKNMPDGSVYAEAEGNEEQLNEFLRWCKKGPVHAHVDDMRIEKGELKGFNFFDIT